METQQNIFQTYELCCFNHKRMKVPIFGNFPQKGRIDLCDSYEIFVSKGYYDTLRGLLGSRKQQDILNSDRKIGEKNGFNIYKVTGAEYVTLAILEEVPNKDARTDSKPSTILIEEHRSRIPEGMKNFWRILGRNRKTHKLVPRGYQTPGFGKL